MSSRLPILLGLVMGIAAGVAVIAGAALFAPEPVAPSHPPPSVPVLTASPSPFASPSLAPSASASPSSAPSGSTSPSVGPSGTPIPTLAPSGSAAASTSAEQIAVSAGSGTIDIAMTP